MGLALVHSRAGLGVEAPPVGVEVHMSGGMPGIGIVGLPEAEVRESRDRVCGSLPAVLQARTAGRVAVVPGANAGEAGLVADGSALAAHHLLAVVAHLRGITPFPACTTPAPVAGHDAAMPDLADVRGQLATCRALEVAAAGDHPPPLGMVKVTPFLACAERRMMTISI